MLYEDLKDIENGRCITKDGGVGSGIKGHVTAEQMKAMKNRKEKLTPQQQMMRKKREELLKKKIAGIKQGGGLLEHEELYIVKPALAAIKKGADPNKAFAEHAENENYHGDRPDIVADRNRIIAHMNKKHKLNIDPEKVNKLL